MFRGVNILNANAIYFSTALKRPAKLLVSLVLLVCFTTSALLVLQVSLVCFMTSTLLVLLASLATLCSCARGGGNAGAAVDGTLGWTTSALPAEGALAWSLGKLTTEINQLTSF